MAKAILFGDQREDGLIRVWRTIHSQPDKQELRISDYPEGYEFEALPEAPKAKKGIDFVMLFNPNNGTFVWDEQERALNDREVAERQTEVMEENNTLLKQLIDELRNTNAKIDATK
ncbi:MAG: hypothetical protein WC346_01430 [Methanogenium sp.]|jgi:hypothetical protein